MADEIATVRTGRYPRDLIRYGLGLCIGVLVLVLLFGKRAELTAARDQLGQVAIAWLAAAIAAEALSLLAYAWLQHHVLRLAGAVVPMPALSLLTLANDAIANSVPGEPAVSSAYRYRFYRRYEVSPEAAGWTIFTILVAQAIGMAVLLLLGVVVALAASHGPGGSGAALAGLVIIAAALAILVRRDLVLRLIGALVRAVGPRAGSRGGGIATRVDGTLTRMRQIPLNAGSAAWVVAIATAVWAGDFGCLLCSFAAVHAPVPWHGVLLAYAVATVAGTLPIVPGGVGIVEGSLAVILAGYGAGRVAALSAALVFRFVSFWLSIAVGWIVIGVIARHMRRRSRAQTTG